jgi:LacI family transcriptional regulator
MPVPVVFVVALAQSPLPMVGQDVAPGLISAAEHLAELGHQRVLWAGLKQASGRMALPARREAFAARGDELGIQVAEFLVDESGFQGVSANERLVRGAYQQLSELIENAGLSGATAIMAYNDLVATGFAQALREHGYRIPQDISLVGYDNFYADLTIPALSTIDMNIHEIGRRGAEMALRCVDDPDLYESMKGQTVRVPNVFVPGGSTAPPRGEKP